MANKFNAKKVEIDNYVFDSKVEARFYVYLKRCKEQGLLTKIIVHPKYEIQHGFSKHGDYFKAITYIADFEVVWNGNKRIVYDIKGVATEEAKLKRKLYIYRFKDPLKWIAYSKKYGNEYGFIDWFELREKRKNEKKG